MKLEDLLSEKGLNYFYIMHLSYNGDERERLWNYAKENNCIGLDYPDVVIDDWNEIPEADKELLQLSPIWVKQFDRFCNEMTVGDSVLVLSGWDSLLGIAEIKNRYRYDKNLSRKRDFFDHVRPVRWIIKYEYDDRFTLPSRIVFNNTLSRVGPNSPRWSILTNLNI